MAGSFLERIVAAVAAELARRQRETPLIEVRRLAAAQPAPLDFGAALRQPGVGVIAEVKRASPSRGVLRGDLDAAGLARAYADGGAVAISVLTEPSFFGGSLDDLRVVRAAQRVGSATAPELPLLRKDFVLDDYQVYEARAAGADAVLLIAAILDDDALARLLRLTRELGMAALVEVHDEAEVERALAAGVLPEEGSATAIVGVNNRDLRSFEVDLATTQRLRPLLPPEVVVVSESGIRSRDDMARLAAWGVNAALIGEALVMAPDPAAALRALL